MPNGRDTWKVQIETNAKEIKKQVEELQGKVIALENGKHELSFDIDTDKLNRVLGKLEKELDKVGNKKIGSGQFEELSDGIDKALARVKELNSALDSADASSKMEASLKGIDESINIMVISIDQLTKKLGNIGKEAKKAQTDVQKFNNVLNQINKQSGKINAKDPTGKTKYQSQGQLDALKKYNDEVAKYKNIFEVYSKTSSDGSLSSDQINKLNAQKDLIDQLAASVKAWAAADQKAWNQSNAAITRNENSLKRLKEKYQDRLANPSEENQNDSYKKNLESLHTALDRYKNKLNEVKAAGEIVSDADISELKVLKENAEAAARSFNNLTASGKGSKEVSRLKLFNKIEEELRDNTKLSEEFKMELRALQAQLDKLGPNADVGKLEAQFQDIIKRIREANQEGKRFIDTVTDKAYYGLAAGISSLFGIEDVIQGFRDGIDTVIELNTALTEMRKVSDESLASLRAYSKETFDIGDSVGATAETIQRSTADFMRLGESMSDAAESAKTTNVLFNVSEFENIDDATEAMISMSQAYKDLEKSEIVDVANKLGNEFAISTEGIATALKDSASALSTAKNDFYEAAALVTAGKFIA